MFERLFHYFRSFPLLFFFIILIVTPGSEALIFSGVPLINKVEYYTFVLLCFYLIYLYFSKNLHLQWRGKSLFIMATLIILSVAKFAAYKSQKFESSFYACYLASSKSFTENCEFNFNQYFLSDITKYSTREKSIDFEKPTQFSRGFLNNQFLYPYVHYSRAYLPFSLKLWGSSDLSDATELVLSYFGKLRFHVNGMQFNDFPESQGESRHKLTLTKDEYPEIFRKDSHLEFFYTYTPEQPVISQQGHLVIKKKTLDGLKSLTSPAILSATWIQWMDLPIFLIIALIMLSLLWQISKRKTEALTLAAACFLFWYIPNYLSSLNHSVFTRLGGHHLPFYRIILPIFFFSLMSLFHFYKSKNTKQSFQPPSILFVWMLFVFNFLFAHLDILYDIDLTEVFIRSQGNDPLGYESNSRIIALSTSLFEFLRGAANSFYAQPFYRFYLFFHHVVFGDGNQGETLFQVALSLMIAFGFYASFARKNQSLLGILVSLATWYFIVKMCFFRTLMHGMQSHVAVLLILIGCCFAASGRGLPSIMLSVLFIGLGALTRMNVLIGCLSLVMGLAMIRYRDHQTSYKPMTVSLAMVLLFIGIYSYVPIHNYVYSGELHWSTGTATGFSKYLQGESDKSLLYRLAFGVFGHPWSNIQNFLKALYIDGFGGLIAQNILRFFQLLTLVSLIRYGWKALLYSKSRVTSVGYFLISSSPFLALLPHLIYSPKSRLIMVGNLMFFATGHLLLLKLTQYYNPVGQVSQFLTKNLFRQENKKHLKPIKDSSH